MRAVKTTLSISFLFLAATVITRDIENRKELPEEIRFAKLHKLIQPTLYYLPPYPTKAYNRGIDCEVWVKVKLNKEGKVDSAAVLYCEREDYGFEMAALEMAKKSKYTAKSIRKKYRKDWLYSQLLFTAKKVGWESTEFYDLHVPRLSSKFILYESMPEIIHRGRPTYPKKARENHIEGDVHMRMEVSTNGIPSIVVIYATTDIKWAYGFNETALRSAMKSLFKPATQGGKPVKVWVSFPYEFKLNEKH